MEIKGQGPPEKTLGYEGEISFNGRKKNTTEYRGGVKVWGKEVRAKA